MSFDYMIRTAFTDKHMRCRKCGEDSSTGTPVVQYMAMTDSLHVSCKRCGYSAEVPPFDGVQKQPDDCVCAFAHSGACPSDRVSP